MSLLQQCVDSCQLKEHQRTSITPFSLMITHQWEGSALPWPPSLAGAAAAELWLMSSLADAASPYSISSSSSTVLLLRQTDRLLLGSVCVWKLTDGGLLPDVLVDGLRLRLTPADAVVCVGAAHLVFRREHPTHVSVRTQRDHTRQLLDKEARNKLPL